MAFLNGDPQSILDEDGKTIYPHIIKGKQGFKVNLTKGSSLPGVYTSYFQAERALERAKNAPKTRKQRTQDASE